MYVQPQQPVVLQQPQMVVQQPMAVVQQPMAVVQQPMMMQQPQMVVQQQPVMVQQQQQGLMVPQTPYMQQAISPRQQPMCNYNQGVQQVPTTLVPAAGQTIGQNAENNSPTKRPSENQKIEYVQKPMSGGKMKSQDNPCAVCLASLAVVPCCFCLALLGFENQDAIGGIGEGIGDAIGNAFG